MEKVDEDIGQKYAGQTDRRKVHEIKILTHRGLDPAIKGYFTESSREAFNDQLARGFGLEFDIQRASAGVLVVFHDSDLARITAGRDTRKIADMLSSDLVSQDFNGCHLVTFSEMAGLIAAHENMNALYFVHIKHSFQKKRYLDEIVEKIEGAPLERIILFDVTVPSAEYIKKINSHIHIAPSIAHPYDRERYNSAVGGTMLTVGEVIYHRDIYDWVWLDEWDTIDAAGAEKKLYSKDTFMLLRSHDFHIALVSPELHATSPGRIGGKAHADGINRTRLKTRLQEILKLQPDAVCTDYPDMVQTQVHQNKNQS